MSSEESLPYSQVAIVAWTILCVVVAVVMFFAFVFNGHLLNTGHWIWDLIRHFAQPII
jgi:hypothetical protein